MPEPVLSAPAPAASHQATRGGQGPPGAGQRVLEREVTQVIALIGMPGGGKSTVGRAVARRLGLPFVDADKVVEDRAGCAIAEIFEREGEDAFRQLEADVLGELVAEAPRVVATGGGVVLRQGNRELLRAQTHCVYLRVRPETLMHRLRRDTRRPLFRVADPEARLHELIAERDPLYQQTAAAVVHTAGLSLERVVGAVVATLPMRPAPVG